MGELSDGLAAEALGMLCALLMDFRRWGVVRTITALDPRFEERIPGLNRNTLPADDVVCTLQGEHEETYLSLLARCDTALILAPETNGILSKLTTQAEAAGIPLLSSCSSSVATAGNKAACYRLFCQAELPTPKTRTARFASIQQVAKDMGCPLVIKPIDGVGSEGVFRVDSLSDLPAILKKIRRFTSHEKILLQSFVRGVPASVSLLASKGCCLPLSLNQQLVEGSVPFQYLGSQVPFHHRAEGYAFKLACEAVSRIDGLNGYVGVDLVLEDERAQLIEINPRLTTSYIGLRQVAQVNLAEAMWKACVEGILPDRAPLIGQVVIKKDDPGSWGFGLKRQKNRSFV